MTTINEIARVRRAATALLNALNHQNELREEMRALAAKITTHNERIAELQRKYAAITSAGAADRRQPTGECAWDQQFLKGIGTADNGAADPITRECYGKNRPRPTRPRMTPNGLHNGKRVEELWYPSSKYATASRMLSVGTLEHAIDEKGKKRGGVWLTLSEWRRVLAFLSTGTARQRATTSPKGVTTTNGRVHTNRDGEK